MSLKGLVASAGLSFLAAGGAQAAEFQYKGLIDINDMKNLGWRFNNERAEKDTKWALFNYEGLKPVVVEKGSFWPWHDRQEISCEALFMISAEERAENLTEAFLARAARVQVPKLEFSEDDKKTQYGKILTQVDKAMADCSPNIS